MQLYRYPFGSPMSSRSFGASGYKYGFNGKEKDEEMNVNGGSYDFGSRIYDSRLGRWWGVDPLRGVYSSISPYAFGADNPIFIIDADGRLLVDKDGNIIYTNNGKAVVAAESYFKDEPTKRVQTYRQDVTVYANDGTEVKAYRIFKVEQKYQDVDVYDREGNVIGTKKDWVDVQTLRDDESYDCHGYTMLNGKFWLDGSEMNKILEHDGYIANQGEGKDVDAENVKEPGQIVVYKAKNDKSVTKDGEVIDIKKGGTTHSAVTKGDGTLNSKNGSLPFGSYTNEQLEGIYDSSSKIYKREPNKVIDISGKNNEKGAREVSKKKVEKALSH